MEQIWACIKNGIVEELIVADVAFIASYANGAGARFDAFDRVDQLTPQPQIGWRYEYGEFSPPVLQVEQPPVE